MNSSHAYLLMKASRSNHDQWLNEWIERYTPHNLYLSFNHDMRVVGHHSWLHNQFPIFLCSPLPSGTCRTPGLYIPWCCLLTSSSVWLVFFPLSSRFARWFWPDLMNGRHVHTTSVCVFLRWSGGLRVVSLPAGSWHTSLTPINLHLLGITDTSDQKIKISRWTRWTIPFNVQILQPGWQC